ncbi:GLPGLI family protein [Solirubrum puertoriconensis]|uniref:GLPGLI family protein n=1 Tax=Solirubrum puertoriconensis TaxID=1751427 RepID=A0A9X0L5D3_SOLP1|nr:GLPGLI family protein [Solirubrum puertoriconensis]KUG08537.1 hypothetical protein ASU33_10285 [Solirubrum puertoriconensis]
MKPLLMFLLLLLLTGTSVFAPANAQTTSGRIMYEGTRRIDPNSMRVVINGQEIKPGSPDFPSDIPDVRSFAMTLSFANGYAKEEREGGAVMRTMVSSSGAAPQVTNIGRPFEEAVYLNLNERATSTVLTLKKDNATTVYRADAPMAKQPTGWQTTEQTKKIAGYTCRKATVPYQKETYTVWYTTELPFTYSPIRDLTPEKGVVLAIEGSKEQFRANKVELKPVKDADVRPSEQAKTVTAEELKDLRDKASADFRQRMMDEVGTRAN